MTHDLKTGGDRGYLRIATEEAWATQEQLDAIMRLVKEGRAAKGTVSLWGFYGTSPSARTAFIRERLVEAGPERIASMAARDGAVFGVPGEGSYHARRMLTTGVFDRYPNLQLMLGHGCEWLPHMLYRLDYMHKAGLRSGRYPRLKPLNHDLFYYFRNNVLATNSGLPFGPAIKTMIEVMGEDRVMYAMDYPYQYVPEEVVWMDDLDIPFEQKKKFFQTNAERWFKL